MKFYVIYSFDLKRRTPVQSHKPPFIKLWQLTEQDDQYDFDYLANESGDKSYRNGKHRKYTGELTKDQFKKFVDQCDLYMEDIETMGSLTIEYGHIPAFSFNSECIDYYGDQPIYKNAYVTPFPEHAIKGKEFNRAYNKRNWNRLKRAMLKEFGL